MWVAGRHSPGRPFAWIDDGGAALERQVQLLISGIVRACGLGPICAAVMLARALTRLPSEQGKVVLL